MKRAPLILTALALAVLAPTAPAQKRAAEETYGASSVDRLPEIANSAEIAATMEKVYPPELRAAGVTGFVVLRFRVRDDGWVDEESVLVSRSSHPAFAEAACAVARRIRFTPARYRGRPVRVWVELPLEFGVALPPPYVES
jgi:periplasmic protein TonB